MERGRTPEAGPSTGHGQLDRHHAPELSADHAERLARALAAAGAPDEPAIAALRGGVPPGISSSLLARMPAQPVVIAAGAEISVQNPIKSPLRNPAPAGQGNPPAQPNVFQRGAPQGALGPATATSFRLPRNFAAAPTAPTRSAALLAAANLVERFAANLLTQYNLARRRRMPGARDRSDIAFGAINNDELLEPFTLVVRVRYGAPATLLRLHYQFDDSYRGYIVGVSEKQVGPQAGPATKADMNTFRPQPGVPAPPMPGQYSNVHDQTGAANLMGVVDAPGQPWDAMTKIAGEAARFQCVKRAALARILSDDLFFHHGGRGIRFKNLWQTWTEFGNDYGIIDLRVRTKLAEWDGYDPPNARTPKERARQQRLKDFVEPANAGYALQ